MTRVIRKSRALMSHEARTLLQAVLVAELIDPSDVLWLVSPWVNDIAVVANSDGRFTDVLSGIDLRDAHLSEVLATLGRSGTDVIVACRPDASNDTFLGNLRNAGIPEQRLAIHQDQSLHEKTLAGDRFFLTGSMNFTRAGLDYNEEQITFETDAAQVAETRAALRERWGP